MIFPISIFLHIGFGSICLLVVAYMLRMELRPIFEKIFDLLYKLIAKFARKDERQVRSQSPLQSLQHFLYGSKE